MKRPRMKISLQVSADMTSRALTNGEEHGIVRLSKSARTYYEAIGTSISIHNSNGANTLLCVKKALKPDIGSSTPSKIETVGFVTQKTYDIILGGNAALDMWTSEHIDNLIVGSDPEFGLIDSDSNLAYAQNTYHYDNNKNAELGTDGPTMELRPAPNADVDAHINNIKKLLKKGMDSKILAKYEWFIGAGFRCKKANRLYTFGGHVHIGNPLILKQAKNRPSDTDIHKRLIRVLDELVGLPLTRIDNPLASQRRLDTGYGKFGDFRQQNERFEWRAPSAIWLSSPALAKAVVSTVKAVSEEVYVRLADKNFNERFVLGSVKDDRSLLCKLRCAPDDVVSKALHNSEIDDGSLTEIHNKLKSMSTYPKYKQYIDEFIAFTSLVKEDANKLDKFIVADKWL